MNEPDFFVCPDCHSPLPEKYRVLPEVVCPNCWQQVCITGIRVLAVTAPGYPPAKVQLHETYWEPVPPSPPEIPPARAGQDRARRASEGEGSDPTTLPAVEQGRGTGESGNHRDKRGRKPLRDGDAQERGELIAAWERFRDSKSGTKKDFCKDNKIGLKILNNTLAWQRTRRNRSKE